MEYLGLFGYFVLGGSSTLFGLGRGPITPPDPATVRTDRKDLNSNKTNNALGTLPLWRMSVTDRVFDLSDDEEKGRHSLASSLSPQRDSGLADHCFGLLQIGSVPQLTSDSGKSFAHMSIPHNELFTMVIAEKPYRNMSVPSHGAPAERKKSTSYNLFSSNFNEIAKLFLPIRMNPGQGWRNRG